MNFCALDDAFQELGSAPSPGCGADYATRQSRKEERKKARRCKGPSAAYLDVEDKDPDRQHLNKLPDVPAMNPATGLREHVPVTASQGSTEPFTEQGFTHRHRKITHSDPNPEDATSHKYHRDRLSQFVRDEERQNVIALEIPNAGNSLVKTKKFFGASGPDEDSYADYIPDQSDYKLQPDFLKAFEEAGVGRAGSSATLPNPSVNMYWKPLSTAGAQSSFIEQLPPPGGKYYKAPRAYDGEISMEDVMKKMDRIFARLDDMNQSSPEQVTSELLMFISSGIFVLFLMDLLVKKGSTLRF
jgi:hypothetical protein